MNFRKMIRGLSKRRASVSPREHVVGPPEDMAAVDADLREAGIDPDAIGDRTAAFAAALLREQHESESASAKRQTREPLQAAVQRMSWAVAGLGLVCAASLCGLAIGMHSLHKDLANLTSEISQTRASLDPAAFLTTESLRSAALARDLHAMQIRAPFTSELHTTLLRALNATGAEHDTSPSRVHFDRITHREAHKRIEAAVQTGNVYVSPENGGQLCVVGIQSLPRSRGEQK